MVAFPVCGITVGEVFPGTYLLCDRKGHTPLSLSFQKNNRAWAATSYSLNKFFDSHSFMVNSGSPS